jgi:hypothetical protein
MICSAGADVEGCTVVGDRRGLKGEDDGVAMMAESLGGLSPPLCMPDVQLPAKMRI